MRTIAISDIHGCYNELKELVSILEKEGMYNKDNDKIIFLGDYVDRGKDSRLVIEFVRNLQKENKNVIALMGNHEEMLLEHHDKINNYWCYNGYNSTLQSYNGFKEQFENDIEWMRNLPLYHEDEHFVFVHAGVDIDKPMKEQDKSTLLWTREDFVYNVKKYYKTVVFGHTSTVYLNGTSKPLKTYNGNIAIDTGCVYDGALSALVIEDGKVKCFYQV